MIRFEVGKHYDVLDTPHQNGYKYITLRPLRHFLLYYRPVRARISNWVSLEPDGSVQLSEGYMWNGPNVVPDWNSLMYPSLIHDPLCQLIAHGELPYSPWKALAAKEFRRLSKLQGRPWLLRQRDYLAVRYLGGMYTPYQPSVT